MISILISMVMAVMIIKNINSDNGNINDFDNNSNDGNGDNNIDNERWTGFQGHSPCGIRLGIIFKVTIYKRDTRRTVLST